MADRFGFGIEEFSRAFDEFFDELLINRWKSMRSGGGQSERAQVLDYTDRYEVSLAAPAADPKKIEVEATGQRITVRIPARSGGGTMETAFSFGVEIDAKAAVTQWSGGTLTIIVPKKKKRGNAVKST